MSTEIPTLDLSIREGVVYYIESMLCQDVAKAYARNGALHPFGAALVTYVNGTKLPRPQAQAAGAFGMDVRTLKRTLRATARNGAATGAILVQMLQVPIKGVQTQVAVVQVEHKEFGDLIWTARVGADGKLGEFTGPHSLKDTGFELARTTMLPQRWMH